MGCTPSQLAPADQSPPLRGRSRVTARRRANGPPIRVIGSGQGTANHGETTMGRSKLACPECGTQFHGSRDVCPFCHACIHQVGGHRCKDCGAYIPTVAELRAIERAQREAARREDSDGMIARNLRRSIPSLVDAINMGSVHGG